MYIALSSAKYDVLSLKRKTFLVQNHFHHLILLCGGMKLE